MFLNKLNGLSVIAQSNSSRQKRHAGMDATLLNKRSAVYEAPQNRHPERWSRHTRNWTFVREVHLNPSQHTVKKEPPCEYKKPLKNN
jgi:putative transposase